MDIKKEIILKDIVDYIENIPYKYEERSEFGDIERETKKYIVGNLINNF